MRIKYWFCEPTSDGLKLKFDPEFGNGTNFVTKVLETGLMSAVGIVPLLKIVEYGVCAGYTVPLSPVRANGERVADVESPGNTNVPFSGLDGKTGVLFGTPACGAAKRSP